MNEYLAQFLFVGEGLIVTLLLLLGGLLLGVCLGTVLALMRYNKWGVFLIDRWVSIVRGTPLILQLSIVYFSAPGLLGLKLSILAAGIITFGLNSSAYIAEILRAGIESIPQGQFEAAKTLEIPNYFMWKDIIAPQVIRNVLPGMINEVIALLKETALIGTIGGMDLMRTAQVLAAEQFTYFVPLCMAGVYYYALVVLIEFIGQKIEQGGFYA